MRNIFCYTALISTSAAQQYMRGRGSTSGVGRAVLCRGGMYFLCKEKIKSKIYGINNDVTDWARIKLSNMSLKKQITLSNTSAVQHFAFLVWSCVHEGRDTEITAWEWSICNCCLTSWWITTIRVFTAWLWSPSWNQYFVTVCGFF